MALTHVGTSPPAFNNTNVAPTVPAGAAAGDHVFLLATVKQQDRDFDPATYTGWTLLFNEFTNPVQFSSDYTAGQGRIRRGVFYRTVPAGGLTAPVIGLTDGPGGNASGTIASGTISVWRSSTGAALDTSVGSGPEDTANSTWDATPGDTLGLTSGDQLLLFSAVTDDAPRFNTYTVTATGATLATTVELADVGSAIGDDTGVGVHTTSVTAGTATAAPLFTATMSTGGGATGGTLFLRFREVAAAPAPVTGTGDLTASPGTLAGSAALALTGAGGLTGPAPSLTGTGGLTLSGTGGLTAAAASLTGAGGLTATATAALTATSPTLAGAGTLRLGAVGTLTAGSSSLTGSGAVTQPAPDAITGTGSLAAEPPSLTGAAEVRLIGSGALAAGAATLAGVAAARLTAAAQLAASAAVLTGVGTVVDASQFRDITVTWGQLRARTIATGPLTGRTLTTSQVRTRALTGRFKE